MCVHAVSTDLWPCTSDVVLRSLLKLFLNEHRLSHQLLLADPVHIEGDRVAYSEASSEDEVATD